MMSRPLVEVLTFEGCPNGRAALRLVEQVGSELRLDPEIRLVDVPDHEAAVRAGFLGSPTIRVDGADIDPHIRSIDSSAVGVSCRIFSTDAGPAGLPDPRWLRAALARAAGARRAGGASAAR
jgi:hypothetical protein